MKRFGWRLDIGLWRSACAAVLLVGLAIARPSPVLAQGRESAAPGEPPGYRVAIGAAVEEYEAKNYPESREHFRRAHELFPNARTLRGLGLVEYELRNYPESVRYLEQALASEVRPLDAMLRSSSEQALARARGYVGRLQLEVEPATVTVVLNGQRAELAPGEPLLLAVGDHVLEFSAAGYAPQRRGITVHGGRTLRLTVELTRLAEPAAGRPEAPIAAEREPGRTPLYKRWWLWTGLGVIAAGAAVTTVLLMRREQRTVYETEPYTTANTPTGLKLHPLELQR